MGKKRLHISKKTVITSIAVILLLAGALGAGILVQMWLGNQNNTGETAQGSLPKVVDEVQNLRVDGKLEEANKKIDEAIASGNISDDEKFLLYIQRGNEAYDKQDYPAATTAYEQALAVKETDEITRLLGEVWQDRGDKPKAIEYFKKTITLLPQNSPMYESNKARLEERIRMLGGQP